MAPSRGFRVNTDKLTDVADMVKRLLDDVSGARGFIGGNLPDFRQADGHELREGLAVIWPEWDDGFATGYGYEHQGMLKTYESMVAQLTALEASCRSTAKAYANREHDSTAAVNAVDNREI
ncbi:MAG: hypothetical protein QOF87_458 [Pseudonocardiales bacterium]|nr:hypothetical protein [Pseudonocardiales bacterium]MDT4960811.1 hypothetical protein [Pseudonocardiales bacterium]MDT4979831.1 hypothetical protein [Pseudonocardiales bacterium]